MKKIILLISLLISTSLFSQECFIGEVRMFAGNFAPRGWALLNGQLLSIAQNTALFSILGTTYGGDGRTTFGLPDMRGRTAVGTGSGPGLSNYRLGQKFGQEKSTLNSSNLPPQNATATMRTLKFSGNTIGVKSSHRDRSVPVLVEEEVQTQVNLQGQNIPVNNIQPSIVINHIICLQGIFPSRS